MFESGTNCLCVDNSYTVAYHNGEKVYHIARCVNILLRLKMTKKMIGPYRDDINTSCVPE